MAIIPSRNEKQRLCIFFWGGGEGAQIRCIMIMGDVILARRHFQSQLVGAYATPLATMAIEEVD